MLFLIIEPRSKTMIINVIDRDGSKYKIECTSEIKDYDRGGLKFTVCGRRWIKTKQKFSGTILGHSFVSYTVETN